MTNATNQEDIPTPPSTSSIVRLERLPHPNPHACRYCATSRATLRLTLSNGEQITSCRPHAANYRTSDASETTAWRPRRPLAMPHETSNGLPLPAGPGAIVPGQRVDCLPGSLPRRDGGQGGGVLVSLGPKTSVVDVHGAGRRRIPNHLLHPGCGPTVTAWRHSRGYRTTYPERDWLPSWSWLGWNIAQHQEYLAGQRSLPFPPTAPERLIIVVCGARKADQIEAPAGELYVGTYHKAARRAAEAIARPGTKIMIQSAWYGLVELTDQLLRYDARLGQQHTITRDGLYEQAEQLGLLDTPDVVVLAPIAYADLVLHVWPDARNPLAGSRGIGEQMARLAALADGRATIDDLVSTKPAGDQHVIGMDGGRVHLDAARFKAPSVPAPACGARRGTQSWTASDAPVSCARCTAIQTRRRDLQRWCAMLDRLAARPRADRPGHGRPNVSRVNHGTPSALLLALPPTRSIHDDAMITIDPVHRVTTRRVGPGTAVAPAARDLDRTAEVRPMIDPTPSVCAPVGAAT
ncbi:DUF6884 domain-containing protein [Dactylosporangium sucinum]|uniref:DUF6884 domain-containing protein n=1 Tax=Dactylosporangium sucinum TaxID=1424081 RepID=A0A917UGP0_9ACTN|nr:DUF6884 domain-containing protein [Dactylosporangium sucinum]GGM86363.1 hypothetical protein GCM10007977_105320 [Dactylosporangium sucinum]